MSTHVYVGRQPIFNRKIEVIGYELLYRGGDTDRAVFTDGDAATSAVISNTFLEIGLDRLVEDKLAFINLTRPFLKGDYPIPMRHDRLVLEVLEDITIDEEMVGALRVLAKQGFTLALDDVVDPRQGVMVADLVSIVKVDLMRVDRSQLALHQQIYKKWKVRTVAEKVETKEDLDLCMRLGFDYFQGYFLCRPNVVKERKLTGTRMAIMRLLSELQSNDLDFTHIDQIVRQDVALSYKLLRLINSAFYARATEIKSIHQALTLLGIRQIRSWVSLLLLSETEDKPRELMTTAMVRAKMCEGLAIAAKVGNPEMAFTTGLFSVLDALMDMPLKDVLSQVPLSQEITSALLDRSGDLGQMLKCVISYEQGNWDQVGFHNLDAGVIGKSYLDAVAWASEVAKILTAK